MRPEDDIAGWIFLAVVAGAAITLVLLSGLL
jgi:hypothetical protein